MCFEDSLSVMDSLCLSQFFFFNYKYFFGKFVCRTGMKYMILGKIVWDSPHLGIKIVLISLKSHHIAAKAHDLVPEA